ncbi:L-2,4-diaminobutyrate decarboxylase [Planctomycetes bacterium Pan216]|uniref:L-2,4-diaminobutyrate decarboxylase n=1 Tax=Kolteria novifilia TaxID=2527975 RepID=A0A518B738_9BACT|nr:L-2,4-diaminobutyrate decarboxylase [Planctomycetes bacterium Pan216]
MATDSLTEAKKRLERAYDPDAFEQAATVFAQRSARYLRLMRPRPAPALPWAEPEALIDVARSWIDREPPPIVEPDDTATSFHRLAETILDHGHRIHSPHYMGHQVPPPVPVTGLFAAIGSLTNQAMAVYEMGPFTTAVERVMIEKLGELVGWNRGGFAGICTHGGSLANLSALLTARHRHDKESWTNGVDSAGPTRPAIITSGDSHYSVARAAGVMGIGTSQVLKAPVDAERRLRADSVRRVLDEADNSGLEVFALVASACATPIGAFDPLKELADVAQERGIWFHVDACHGASVLFSQRHRHLVEGIDRADSVVWDAHKMLFVPALCTFVLYRDAAVSYETFQQDAPYLFDADNPGMAEYDGAVRTLECTKSAMALPLWGLWSIYGPELFEDLVDVTFALGATLAKLLEEKPDFQLMHKPDGNIVCFRHVPEQLAAASDEELSRFQQGLRRRLLESSRFYITATRLEGNAVLRVTLINPLTERDHLEGLLDALREEGGALLTEGVE